MTCENANCTGTAKWQPQIICRDAGGAVLLKGDTHTVVCDDCKDVATIDAFMDDGQYAIMCEAFQAQAKTPPAREDITIELLPL